MPSILLIKTSSLGDVIHNLPTVSDIRRLWPDAVIDWVVEENFADIPRLHAGVRRVIPVAIRRWRKAVTRPSTRAQITQFVNDIGEHNYDFVIDTQGLVKSAFLARLAQGVRCGYSRKSAREALASFFYQRRFDVDRALHAVVRNRQLTAAALGYKLDELPLDYGLHPEPQLFDWLGSGAYAVLLTATSRDDKLWPEAHWVALGQALQARGLRAVLPSGSDRERERAQRIVAQIPHACLAPPSAIRDLSALMSSAQCVIGVDTGLTHLAAALDVPVAAIYVSTHPGLTGVYAGARAMNLGGVGQVPSVEEVLAALGKENSRLG